MNFKPSVSTDGGATFDENALTFATREEAEAYAKDLMARWPLVTDWRVVKSEQPVNYAFKDGVLTVVEDKETMQLVVENADEILDALDNAVASLENVLLHHGHQMTPSDQAGRWNVVNQARGLLARVGWTA